MRAVFALLATLGVVGATACATTTASTSVPPVTGVLVRADELTAKYGCGRNAGQVFRYVATVVDTNQTNIAGQVVDCFADAWFVNLPPAADSGSTSYGIAIFAFDEPTFTALNANGLIDASASNLVSMQQIKANYSAKCTATQSENVQTIASCEALLP